MGATLAPAFALRTFLLLAALKWLLVPTYLSTDFDVHRNWLALTSKLPLADWYFDNVGGTTVHTLDYPPLFAFFEAALSNNHVTTSLLENGWLDERCLALLPDDDNAPSERCIRFHRATVILSDVVLFLGAYLAVHSMALVGDKRCVRAPQMTFLLIVTNPGLIMLDHIHFQYNGMLLGVLLASIAFIVRGQTDQRWELLGAATFASLLAMKHLYLMLAPLYFVYLLRRHCFVAKTIGNETAAFFSVGRLAVLGAVTLACFLGPFIPFLMQSDPTGQMQQIMKRLFPFGRGLVHDYWAANVWALYLFNSRVATFFYRKAPIPGGIRVLLDSLIPFPEPPPSLVAICLLVGLCPALFFAWKMGGRSLVKPDYSCGEFFVAAVVFCSMSGFMLGYHVHEKAIMTAIIPLTLLTATHATTARFYIRLCAFGLFGLLPLLFRPEELLLKVMLYVAWMSGAIYALERVHGHGLLQPYDKIVFAVLTCVLAFMEVIHPMLFMPSGRMEFLPLMATSVICAVGLMLSWGESLILIGGLLGQEEAKIGEGCWYEEVEHSGDNIVSPKMTTRTDASWIRSLENAASTGNVGDLPTGARDVLGEAKYFEFLEFINSENNPMEREEATEEEKEAMGRRRSPSEMDARRKAGLEALRALGEESEKWLHDSSGMDGFQKRYKELRKTGLSTKDAMAAARAEHPE
ncbi:hypothetical protein ACHAXT_011198 [Thalassiosira profunda]